MLIVHHLGISQSDRIVWLCEELGIPYEMVKYDRDPVTRLAPAEYKALHPSGTAPVITDGDLTLGESRRDHRLHRREVRKWPPHPSAKRPGLRELPHTGTTLANGSLMPHVMMKMGGGPLAEAIGSRVDRGLKALDDRLGAVTWLAGESFTVADIMIAFPLTTARLFVPMDLSPYPNILAYLQRLAARPAFQRAMSKADPGLEIKLT